MAHRSTLVTVSAVQLAAQLSGHALAVRRRRHVDVPFITGSPEHVARDWLWFGTAFSGPSYLMACQVWATVRLIRGPDDRASRLLQWLGTGVTVGYLGERLVRARMRPGGSDPLETPIVATGWGCALAPAVLARR